MKRNKVRISVVMLGLLLLIATASQAVTINVLSVQDPFYFALEKLVPQFEKETGIKVNLQGLAYDTIHAKLVASFVARTEDIDCLTQDLMWVSQYAENRWTIPLTPYIERDKEAVKIYEFQPQTLYSHEWRGDIYSLPANSYSHLVLYRTDLLEKAGLRQPPASGPSEWWTWNEYMDYVRKIDNMGGGIHGTVICGAQPVPIVHMYTGIAVNRGERWFKQFPKAPWDFTPTVNTEGNLETVRYYKELYEHSPADSINYMWYDAGVAFATKDIGLLFHWAGYASLVQSAGYMVEEPSKIVGKFGVAISPHQPGKEYITSLGGWGFAIPGSSVRKEEAWEFIKWATSKETQKAMALTAPEIPLTGEGYVRTPLFKDKDVCELYPWMCATAPYSIENANGKLSRPPMPIYTTLEGFYGLQLNKVLAGFLTPEKALTELQSQFELVLKQNMYLPFKGISYDDTIENIVEMISRLSS